MRRSRIFMPPRNQISAAAGIPQNRSGAFSIKRPRRGGSVATQFHSDLDLLVIRDGEIQLVRETPPPGAVLEVAEALRMRSDKGHPVATDHLAGISIRFAQHSGVASGVLAVFFGPNHRDT